jgi:succinylglutamate desuccinylase
MVGKCNKTHTRTHTTCIARHLSRSKQDFGKHDKEIHRKHLHIYTKTIRKKIEKYFVKQNIEQKNPFWTHLGSIVAPMGTGFLNSGD